MKKLSGQLICLFIISLFVFSVTAPLSVISGTELSGLTDETAYADEAQTNMENKPSDLSSLLSSLSGITYSDLNIGTLFVPSRPSKRSDVFAMQLLGLSSGYMADDTASLFQSADLEVLVQEGYEKEMSDPSHSCAYTIGQGSVFKGLSVQNAIVVSIRGTSGGEWYSNFDFCPSHSDEALFSENFLFCAEDVFLTLKDYIDTNEDSLIVVCGHSRGAACANLLGVLLNGYTDPSMVYVYTFATPATIRNANLASDCNNIYNYINPCDLVPRLPLYAWGFVRAGQDIILPVDDADLQNTVTEYEQTIFNTSDSISSYYNERHSLTGPGTDSNGITSYELMLAVSEIFIRYSENLQPGILSDDPTGDVTDFSGISSITESVSDDSSLKGISDMFSQISKDNFSIGQKILMQHLPMKYLELLQLYINEGKKD